MANGEKKGITVKIDAELHAKVREFIEANNMTMAEFVSQALDNELNPKFREDVKNMENTRTIAFQVPESLYQEIKDYLQRNNMTQKMFMIGLIQEELERDRTMRESPTAEEFEAESGSAAYDEPTPESAAERPDEGFRAPGEYSPDMDEGADVSGFVNEYGSESVEDEAEDFDEDEDEGFAMSM